MFLKYVTELFTKVASYQSPTIIGVVASNLGKELKMLSSLFNGTLFSLVNTIFQHKR